MIFDAKINFLDGDKTFFLLAARIFFLANIFFSYCRKKVIVPGKKNLAARKKMFCRYIKKRILGIREHFCECTYH